MSQIEGAAVTFLASFPPIQSAIKVHGSGDGMRIQLDIPESEMANAIELLAWRQRILRVTVQLGLINRVEQHGMETRRERKSKWQAAEASGDDGDSGEGWQSDH